MLIFILVAGTISTCKARSALRRGEDDRRQRYKDLRTVLNERIATLNGWVLDETKAYLSDKNDPPSRCISSQPQPSAPSVPPTESRQ